MTFYKRRSSQSRRGPFMEKTTSPSKLVLLIPILLAPLLAAAESTGFYHVEQKAGWWWIVDPQGKPFLAIGTDHCNYRVHWCEKLGYAPYHRNCVKKYEGNEKAWARSATDRLKKWGFTCLGANSSRSTRRRGLPHTEFCGFGTLFASIDAISPKKTWTGFPNVFNPRFEKFCDERARKVCAPNRDDPMLLGYFLDNELEWFGKNRTKWGLCDDLFSLPPHSSARAAFARFIRDRYKKIGEFNKVWGTKFKSFGELQAHKGAIEVTDPHALADKLDFVRLIADRYFAITTAAVRKYDPNHMILGARFAGEAPNIWDIAGTYCDVVSVNCYRRLDVERGIFTDGFPEELDNWARMCGRPMMVTEWSFPALDSGLPCKHGAGERFDTQAQRASAYALFQKFLFSRPYIVGSMFFMWVDEPKLGISRAFPEDSNYGLVNEQDEPYTALTRTASKVNRLAEAIHAGRIAEVGLSLGPEGKLLAENYGRAAAEYTLRMAIDGKVARRRLEIAPSGKEEIAIPNLKEPGGHLLVCDLEGAEDEVNLSDNRIYALRYNAGSPWTEGVARRLPIVAANPTTAAVSAPLLSVALPRAVEWAALRSTRFREAATGREIAHQVVAIDGRRHLLFRPNKPFEPLSSVTYFLTEGKKSAGTSPAPLLRVRRTTEGLVIENGRLRLAYSNKTGCLLDKVELDGIELGRVSTLVWQKPGGNVWTKPVRTRIVGLTTGPAAVSLEILSEYNAGATTHSAPGEKSTEGTGSTRGSYTIRHIITVPPATPWFEVRALELKNTDAKDWMLWAHYICVFSKIGGTSEDDEVGGPDVPNYYRLIRGWFDPKNNLTYGVLLPKQGNYRAYFWTDKKGKEHPDLWQELKKLVRAGETVRLARTPVFVFGVQGEREKRTWSGLFERISALSNLRCQVFREETRKNPDGQ